MEIIAYITVNLLLFSSWYIFLFRNKNHLSFIDRVLGTFVLGLAQIVLTEMVLGVLFKKLYASPLFILNISISLGVLTFAAALKRRYPLKDIFKELKDEVKHFFNIIKSDWILLTVFILFFISFCYLVFIGYLFPSYSWDAVFYHLPTVGFIMQSGTIEYIPYNSLIYTFINVFPKNIDLFFLWNIIFLKSDAIVDLSQLIFTLAGMLAVYSLAIKMGVKEKYAVYSCLLFFFAPVIILQSTANYIDIAVSVLFLIALNFFIHSNKHGAGLESEHGYTINRNIYVFVAGLTTGVLFGSKGSGPLFLMALSLFFVITELKYRLSFRQGGINTEPGSQFTLHKIIMRYAVFIIIPALLFGSYWYIQNWIHYNNPLYPFTITFLGKVLFRGIFTELLVPAPDIIKDLSPLTGMFYVWLEKVDYYFYASDLSGFGPLWFILFLPSIVFSIFYSVFKKRYDFLLIAVIVLFVLIPHPNNWNTRYVIFLFGLGSLAFGVTLTYFDKRGRVLLFVSLLLAIYISLLVPNSQCIKPEKVKEFISLPAKERTLGRMEPCILDKTQSGDFGMWTWIASNVKEGDILAYTFTPTILSPLWNSSFSNKIVYIKAGKFNNWLRKLEANNTTYILVRPRTLEYWWLTRLAELRRNPRWKETYKRFNVKYSDKHNAVIRFK